MALGSTASELTVSQNTVGTGTGACTQAYTLQGRRKAESESTHLPLVETGSYHVALAGLGLTI